MYDTTVCPRDTLTDDALLNQLRQRLAQERQISAEVLRLIAEVDRRKLYAQSACDSMFTFATQRLGLSESAAYKRIHVARAARRFPSIIERVARGQLHLSGLTVLVPHLTTDNQRDLLDAASGLGRRQIEQLVAVRFPKPDVTTSLRKLPTARQAARRSGPSERAAAAPDTAVPDATPQVVPEWGLEAAAAAAPQSQQSELGTTVPVDEQHSEAAPQPVPRRVPQRPQPLSAQRYLLKVTVSAQLRDKLRESQDLMCSQIPDGDIAVVIEHALDLLIAQQLKKKAAIGVRARRAQPAPKTRRSAGAPTGAAPASATASASTSTRRADPRSRAIPAAIRRAVYQRDGGQCCFVDPITQKRCQARGRLQFHHDVPFAKGGPHSVANVLLLCATHNAYLARRDYGAEHIEAALASRTAKATPPTPAQRVSLGPRTRPGASAALPAATSPDHEAAADSAAQSPVESSPAPALARRSQSHDSASRGTSAPGG